MSVLEDLGIQMAPHSTLNSYLEKLLVLLTGNLGVPGGVNIHSHFVALLGGGADGRGQAAPSAGHRLVTGLVPCNVIPDEILTDHPDRFRAMLVESGNPVHSIADSPRCAKRSRPRPRRRDRRRADRDGTRGPLRVPRGVAVREVGVHVLQPRVPAQRLPPPPPLFDPAPGTLPEPEIHAGCATRSACETTRSSTRCGRHRLGRDAFAEALFEVVGARPELRRIAAS